MIKDIVKIQEAEIAIDHDECLDPSWCRDKELFIESNSNENNTLTTVTFNGVLSIYIYWESHLSAASFEVLYTPETGVLFIGCGNLSARVSIKESKLLDIDYVFLFWSLERHKNYILETGELECFLYNLNGEKISSTAVDPPYEIEILDEGIKFKSIVSGTTWLTYNNNG